MSFGNDLTKEFRKLTMDGEYQEVELITKLQDAFINLAKGKYRYAIDIIHGNRSFVDFQYNASWLDKVPTGKTFTRELSDMMFLVFNKEHKHIRLIYLQNKKGDSSTKFKADLLQLCLLKNRCVITSSKLPACTFGDANILHDADLPSVGSYGVFYSDNKVTDMAYYPASNVKPVTGRAVTTNRTAKFDRTKFGQKKMWGAYSEDQGERNLKGFSDALIGMEIGTPITPKHPAYGAIVSFLRESSICFAQSGFEENDDYPREYVRMDFAGIPFVCVINAGILMDPNPETLLNAEDECVEE